MADLVGLFDLDDTLVRRRETFGRWAAEFADDHGVPLEWLLLKTDPAYSSRRVEFFELAKAAFGLKPPVSELQAQYRRRMPELVEPDPQVCATLARLREAGWRLGVVTNGMVDNQTNKLHRAGLYDLVDTVVISDAVEIRKPDARIFRHAITSLGAEPGPHVVMVGDSLESDIAGAQRAGLTGVGLPRPTARRRRGQVPEAPRRRWRSPDGDRPVVACFLDVPVDGFRCTGIAGPSRLRIGSWRCAAAHRSSGVRPPLPVSVGLSGRGVHGHSDRNPRHDPHRRAPAADRLHYETAHGVITGKLNHRLGCACARIGIDHPEYRTRAIDIGERLQVLKDYPASPGCTSPFVPVWINEMVRRQHEK